MAKKNVTLAEEKAAALQEDARQHSPITPTNFKNLQRVHELQAQISAMNAEIEGYKAAIYAEMDRKGVDVLTRQGVIVVDRKEMDGRRSIDFKTFLAIAPDVVKKVVTYGDRFFQINWRTPKKA